MNHCKDCRWWGEEDQIVGVVGSWTRGRVREGTTRVFCAPCLFDKKKGIVVLGSDDCTACPKRDSIEVAFGPDFGCVHWEPKPPAPGPDGGE